MGKVKRLCLAAAAAMIMVVSSVPEVRAEGEFAASELYAKSAWHWKRQRILRNRW